MGLAVWLLDWAQGTRIDGYNLGVWVDTLRVAPAIMHLLPCKFGRFRRHLVVQALSSANCENNV